MTFTLSIEKTAGKAEQYGFHLGTNERLARQIIAEKMATYCRSELPVVSMALMLKGKIVDVLYPNGEWHEQSGLFD
jgi:hypothetical protein